MPKMKGFICKCLYWSKLSTDYVSSGINNYWKIIRYWINARKVHF